MSQTILTIKVEAQDERSAWISLRKRAIKEGYNADLIPAGTCDTTLVNKDNTLVLTGHFKGAGNNILTIVAQTNTSIN